MTDTAAKHLSRREFRAEWMSKPGVREAFERIGAAMELAFALMDAGHEAGLTQAEVAARSLIIPRAAAHPRRRARQARVIAARRCAAPPGIPTRQDAQAAQRSSSGCAQGSDADE